MFALMLGMAAIVQDRSVAGIPLDAPDGPPRSFYDDGNWSVLSNPEQGQCMGYADSLTADAASNDSGVTVTGEGGSMQVFAFFDQPDSYIVAFRWADSPKLTGSIAVGVVGYDEKGVAKPKKSMKLEMRGGFATTTVPKEQFVLDGMGKIAISVPGHADFAISMAGGTAMVKALEDCRARKGV